MGQQRQNDELLRFADVLRICGGISRPTVYDRIRRGEFPPPLRFGPKVVRWRAADVQAYLSRYLDTAATVGGDKARQAAGRAQ